MTFGRVRARGDGILIERNCWTLAGSGLEMMCGGSGNKSNEKGGRGGEASVCLEYAVVSTGNVPREVRR